MFLEILLSSMSTIITHPIVPIALGVGLGTRLVSPRVLLVGCLFSVLPDLDVLGFWLGVSYYSPWGHRGFMHSLLVAMLCALVATLLFRRYYVAGRHPDYPFRPAVVFLFLWIAMASHPLMDAMTRGGLGVALFWPLSEARLFFDWRPLPVPAVGIEWLFGYWGKYVMERELLRIWLPMLGLMGVLYLLRRLLEALPRARK